MFDWGGRPLSPRKPTQWVVPESMLKREKETNMHTVKIDTMELLAKLTANLATHCEEYEEAMTAYKDEVVGQMEENLSAMESAETPEEIAKATTSVHLSTPKLMKDEYETAIRMLEMSVDENTELTTEQFEQFVMDKWHWKDMLSNSHYAQISRSK
tara:strand:+ start:63 stop:530 length:468 start_codon:yes stop_codon:yes gene_type:complete